MKVLSIVQAAAVGWIELLIPFIPMLAEMLTEILKNCANDEDDAVKMLCSPSPWMFDHMVRRVQWKLWWSSSKYRALSNDEKKQHATRVVKDVVAQANEDPSEVVGAWRESKGLAA